MSRMPKQCDTRIVVAAPIDRTIMKAQFPSVMAIWLALMMAADPNQPIMMPVPTKADDSRNICRAIGSPMCVSRRTTAEESTRCENPSR